jgi:hypothetical protein
MMTREHSIKVAERLRRLTPEQIDNYEMTPIPSEEQIRADIVLWKQRVADVFAEITAWLADDGRFSASLGDDVEMNHPYIVYYGLPGEALPTLSIRGTGGDIMQLEPDTPWITLTAGRIAMRLTVAAARRALRPISVLELRLLYFTDTFIAPLGWLLAGHLDRGKLGEPLSKASLTALLERIDGPV